MLKTKICENCKASFVPELKNQTLCNNCKGVKKMTTETEEEQEEQRREKAQEKVKQEIRTAEIIARAKQTKATQENPLERHKRKIQEKVKELLKNAEVKERVFAEWIVKLFRGYKSKVSEPILKDATQILCERQFLVTIYEENTEFLACMQMLAEISKWFNVKPI